MAIPKRRHRQVPPGQVVDASPFAIQAIEEDILGRLQSGRPSYLVATEKEPRAVTLPLWPGVTALPQSVPMPVIDQSSNFPNRWQKISRSARRLVTNCPARSLRNNRS